VVTGKEGIKYAEKDKEKRNRIKGQLMQWIGDKKNLEKDKRVFF
jgi:hypothetical protein